MTQSINQMKQSLNPYTEHLEWINQSNLRWINESLK